MGDITANLFSEFKAVSNHEWKTKLEKDLKGKPISSLHFNPEFDLKSKANFHPEEFVNQTYSNGSQLNNDNNDWAISESYIDLNSTETNKAILTSLNEGISGLKITISDSTDFETLFNNVLIEHLFVHIVCTSKDNFTDLVAYLKTNHTKVSIIEMPFLSNGLINGTLSLDQLFIDDFIEQSAEYCTKNLIIDGLSYCQFGASSAQELGIALSQLNEYIQRLSNQKVDDQFWQEKVGLHLGVTDNYFVNIAKFRAAKELVLQLQSQWEIDSNIMPWVSAETVNRHITVNDRQNNVLRQTTAAMSAVLGGVCQLIVRPYHEVTKNDEILSGRMAKNIQLILKDEVYFNQVIDPSAGAYAIESYTDQLIEKAWEYFLIIESKGGYYKALSDNTIHQMINDSKISQTQLLNSGTKTLLGINKFQNGAESWQSTSPATENKGDFNGFSPFNLEQNFEKQMV
ncbi:MAG: methylmalonyl-CoA mutase family protein [Crocinitomicaceae bacterium]